MRFREVQIFFEIFGHETSLLQIVWELEGKVCGCGCGCDMLQGIFFFFFLQKWQKMQHRKNVPKRGNKCWKVPKCGPTKMSERGDFIVLLLLSAHIERFRVSHMRDFKKKKCFFTPIYKGRMSILTFTKIFFRKLF